MEDQRGCHLMPLTTIIIASQAVPTGSTWLLVQIVSYTVIIFYYLSILLLSRIVITSAAATTDVATTTATTPFTSYC